MSNIFRDAAGIMRYHAAHSAADDTIQIRMNIMDSHVNSFKIQRRSNSRETLGSILKTNFYK